MGDRNFNVTSLAVIGALIYVLAGLSPGAHNAAPPAVEKKVDQSTLPSEGSRCSEPVYHLLCQFYATDSSEEARRRFVESDSRVILATVPDPVDSSVGSEFDEALDALRMAMAQADYQPDRFYLPWTQPTSSVESTTEVRSDSLNTTGQANAEAHTSRKETTKTTKPRADRPHRHSPGALLFRKAGDEVALVLIVGETPTTGLAPDVAYAAFWYWSDLVLGPLFDGDPQYSPQRRTSHPHLEVPIIGPTFSGSAASLRRILDNQMTLVPQGIPVDFRIISGSATNRDIKPLLENGSRPTSQTRFRSVQHSDSTTLDVLGALLHDYHLTENLLLHEADTTYGNVDVSGKTWTLESSYPIHVSQVRDAYEEHGISAQNQLAFPAASQGALPLSARTDNKPQDTPPVLFQEQSARDIDLALAGLLEAIERRGVQSVTILGTRPEDKLFLASLVHQHAPNAQIILLESDVVYAHPAQLADLLGAWVVSTYPRPSFASTLDNRPAFLSFRSALMEGVYNATLATLYELSPDANRTKVREGLADYRSRKEPDVLEPSIWLSAVGREELWPLREWSVADGADFLWRPKLSSVGTFPQAMPLMTYHLLLAFVAALLLFFSGSYWWYTYFEPPSPWLYFRALSWLCHSIWARPLERIMAALFFLALLPVSLYATWIAAIPVWTPGNSGKVNYAQASLTIVGLAACASMFVTAVDLLLRAAIEWRRGRAIQSRTAAAGFGLLMCLLASSGLIVMVVVIGGRTMTPFDILQAERCMTLRSGLSAPLTALFLTASLAIAAHAICRNQRLAHHLRNVSGFARGSNEYRMFVEQIEAAIGWQPSYHILLACLVSVALLIPLMSGGAVSPDWLFGDVLRLAVPFIAGLVILLLLHGLQVWRALRRLLRALAASPLAPAFSRLPKEKARTVGLRPSAEPSAAAELRYDVDQVATLVAAGFLKKAAVQRWRTSLAGIADRSWWTYSYETSVQTGLSGLASALLLRLDVEWWSSPAQWQECSDQDGANEDALKVLRGNRNTNSRGYLLMEEFVACEITRFISFVCSLLKNTFGAAQLAAVLLLIAVSSYPFQPQRQIMSCALAVLLVVVGIFFGLIILADRNDLLSRISNRTSNKIDFDASFVSQMMTYVAVPLAAALATQFPALGQWLSAAIHTAGR